MMMTMHLVLFLATAIAAPAVQADDNLDALVDVLKAVDDAGFQRDILKGLNEGLKGRRNVRMPAGWPEVSAKLAKSPSAEVRELARSVGTAFGDPSAFKALRRVVSDSKSPLDDRRRALDTLVTAGDKDLAGLLPALLLDPKLRGSALRAMASYDDPSFPGHVLEAYPSFNLESRRDAINTLSARPAFAHALIRAIKDGRISRSDISAFSVRQLRAHGDDKIDAWISREWGSVRATPEARLREIAAMKKKLEKGRKGDPSRGRAIYAKTCRQCHTLYGDGGKVGPDLTGSNRANLDYLLHNMLDPSAEVGKDYQAYVIRTRSGRILTGTSSRHLREDVPTVSYALW